jgi:nucleoside permease NupC
VLTVILRSVCVGVAFVVTAIFLSIFVGLPIASIFLPKDEAAQGGVSVGWDLVSIAHNSSATTIIVTLIVFAAGFLFGYRHFSKSMVRN